MQRAPGDQGDAAPWCGRTRIRIGDIRGGEPLLPFAKAKETEAAGLAAGSGREIYGRAI